MTDTYDVQAAMLNIDHPEFLKRKAAIQTLARAKHEPAIPRLIAILYDTEQHERVRAIVARALGKIGGTDAYFALVNALSNIDPAILKQQVAFKQDASETYQLHNTMLAVALTVALKAINTPEARKVLRLWHSGNLKIDTNEQT